MTAPTLTASYVSRRVRVGWDKEWMIFEVMVASGCYTPAQLAQFATGAEHPIRLSHAIEDRAAPGTVWEAIFDILCGDILQ